MFICLFLVWKGVSCLSVILMGFFICFASSSKFFLRFRYILLILVYYIAYLSLVLIRIIFFDVNDHKLRCFFFVWKRVNCLFLCFVFFFKVLFQVDYQFGLMLRCILFSVYCLVCLLNCFKVAEKTKPSREHGDKGWMFNVHKKRKCIEPKLSSATLNCSLKSCPYMDDSVITEWSWIEVLLLHFSRL